MNMIEIIMSYIYNYDLGFFKFSASFFTGQKKLGKVITPDPWKSGARNTTGRLKSRIYFIEYVLCKVLVNKKREGFKEGQMT